MKRNRNSFRSRWGDANTWRILTLFLFLAWFLIQNRTEKVVDEPNLPKNSNFDPHFEGFSYHSKLAKPGGRAQQRPNVKTDKIKAYLISTNSSSERFLSSKSTLERCGFYVIHVQPINSRDSLLRSLHQRNLKIHSNKFTMKMIWDWITSDPTLDSMEIPLSLIFEDDIELNQDFKHYQVPGIVMEIARMTQRANYSGLFYLGYGRGTKWPMCDESGAHERIVDGVHYNTCNGRLFHATGLLKYQGKWLYDRVEAMKGISKKEYEYPFMDALVQLAFEKLDWDLTPYAAGWNTQDPRAGWETDDLFNWKNKTIHLGVFFQDRNRFEPMILS
eukprot:TRINITY_DN4650_c0_g1_i2.p1 TRINITY_DN4650_c0_g1~~TRINITY_DN4650_c0_g1_i2.p1  ORF type:complete len:331 (+),score=52.09 TRINITY_DN4650_c0_g1_i2:14-1006(+)